MSAQATVVRVAECGVCGLRWNPGTRRGPLPRTCMPRGRCRNAGIRAAAEAARSRAEAEAAARDGVNRALRKAVEHDFPGGRRWGDDEEGL